MRFRARLGCAALAIAVAMVTACSSGPSGQAAADTARSQALSGIRALYQRILHAHVGFSDGLYGYYRQCPGGGQSELFYDVVMQKLYVFNRSVSGSGLRQAMMKQAQSGGWTFRRYIKNSRDGIGNSFPYQMEKGELDGHISVNPPDSSYRYPGYNGLIEIESPCFDAGSAASRLSKVNNSYPLPLPTRLPSS
jgi:hypothetical protein